MPLLGLSLVLPSLFQSDEVAHLRAWFTFLYRTTGLHAVVSLCQSWSYPCACGTPSSVLPLSLPCICIIARFCGAVNTFFKIFLTLLNFSSVNHDWKPWIRIESDNDVVSVCVRNNLSPTIILDVNCHNVPLSGSPIF